MWQYFLQYSNLFLQYIYNPNSSYFEHILYIYTLRYKINAILNF